MSNFKEIFQVETLIGLAKVGYSFSETSHLERHHTVFTHLPFDSRESVKKSISIQRSWKKRNGGHSTDRIHMNWGYLMRVRVSVGKVWGHRNFETSLSYGLLVLFLVSKNFFEQTEIFLAFVSDLISEKPPVSVSHLKITKKRRGTYRLNLFVSTRKSSYSWLCKKCTFWVVVNGKRLNYL